MPARPGRGVCLVKSNDLYHIEQSEDPVAHVGRMASLLPFEVELVHIIPTDDAQDVKKRLHEHFAPKQVRQAWFALDAADVAWIAMWGRGQQTGSGT